MKSGRFAFWVVLAVLSVAGAQPGRFDGTWWARATEPVRTSFLDGDVDCSAWGLKTPALYSDPVTQYSKLVTGWYGSHPAASATPVEQVMEQFRDAVRHPHSKTWSTVDTGALWTSPHWFYNGQYWAQTYGAGGSQALEAFVEGYLSCLAGAAPLMPARFSMPAAAYVPLITRWYRFNGQTGKIDEHRARTPIADVLMKFRDGAGERTTQAG